MKAAELTRVLAKEKPHIVHFSGHGSPDEIIFEGPDEKSRFVHKGDVIDVFRNLTKKPRIVFLNACWTAENLEDLRNSVDFVIATRNTVFDPSAIEFAAKFYELLGHGESVKSAFNLTRKQFDINGAKNQVDMYELVVRDGAKDRVMIRSTTRPDKKKPGSNGPGGGNHIDIKDSDISGGMFLFQGNEEVNIENLER
jgi:hypothetical protein